MEWSAKQLEVLESLYPVVRTSVLAEMLGRRVSSVQKCAQRRGLKKTAEFLSQIRSENAKANPNAGQWNKRHGYANPNNPTYNSWWSMRQRCEDPRHKSYDSYGGRGIRVCEEWHDFSAFLRDMGERPSRAYTLGRSDSNGNYEPGNCQWETHKQQQNNRRSNRFLTAFGKEQTVAQWAEETGITRSAIEKRLDQMGWSVERAVSVPMRSDRRRKAREQ